MNYYKCPDCKVVRKGEDRFSAHMYEDHKKSFGISAIGLFAYKVAPPFPLGVKDADKRNK